MAGRLWLVLGATSACCSRGAWAAAPPRATAQETCDAEPAAAQSSKMLQRGHISSKMPAKVEEDGTEATGMLVLMQDFRSLPSGHFLAWDPSKPRVANIDTAFEHFVISSGLKEELTDVEMADFEDRFEQDMQILMNGTEAPAPHQWQLWLRTAFQDEKPEITEAMERFINSANKGFTVKVQPWMRNISHRDIQMRLGVPKPSGPEPAPPPTSAVQMAAVAASPREFAAHIEWPSCGEVIRRDHNQGSCGSCWAFAALSVLDSRLCIKTNGRFSGPQAQLSRTYATSCARQHGCQGGWGHEVFNLAAQNGIPTGGSVGCLPYFSAGEGINHFDEQDVAPSCPGTCVRKSYGRSLHYDKFRFGTTQQGWQYSQDNAQRTETNRVRTVQQAIMSDGPVVAYVHCDQAFFAYNSGIYNSACEQPWANHAVAAIGWGGNDCPNGYGSCPGYYWSLLNSWGGHWGDGGEIKVAPCVTTSFDIPGPITESDLDGLPEPLLVAGEALCEESPSTAVYHGYIYRTLTGLEKDNHQDTCEKSWTALPSGYELVEFDQDIYDNVVAKRPWSTHGMVFGQSGTWHTGGGWSGQNTAWKVETSGGKYKAPVCHLAILIRRPCISPSAMQVPGNGWCVDAAGREGTARKFIAGDCSKAQRECYYDANCVAYACDSIAVLYTSTGCTDGCSNRAWLANPNLIVKAAWDGAQTQWANAVCYVKTQGQSHARYDGETYCQTGARLTDKVRCGDSSCCHWNAHEPGEASFNGAGRCWSNIGRDMCHSPFEAR